MGSPKPLLKIGSLRRGWSCPQRRGVGMWPYSYARFWPSPQSGLFNVQFRRGKKNLRNGE